MKYLFLTFLCLGCSFSQASDSACGILNCKTDEYCKYESGCGKTDEGVCVKKPQLCNKIYSPVCGCDDQTYSNKCVAAMAGVSIKDQNKCKSNR